MIEQQLNETKLTHLVDRFSLQNDSSNFTNSFIKGPRFLYRKIKREDKTKS